MARSRLALLGSAVLFSTAGTAIKACALTGWQVAGFRAAVAAVAIRAVVHVPRRGYSRRSALVALAYAATVILFVHANKLTTAANTIYLQAAAPLYVVLLSPFLLKERVRRIDLVALGLIAAGMVFLVAGRPPAAATAPDPVTGNVLAAISTVTSALMMIGLRWLARAEGGAAAGSAPAAVVLGNLTAFVIVLPLAVPVATSRPADWLILGYLGTFQIGVAYALLIAGLRHVPVIEASLLLMVEPLLSPVWAWLVHGEQPGPWALAGGALILAATVVRTARR